MMAWMDASSTVGWVGDGMKWKGLYFEMDGYMGGATVLR